MSRDKGYGVNIKKRKAKIFAIVLALSMVISLFVAPVVGVAAEDLVVDSDVVVDFGSAVGTTEAVAQNDVEIPAFAGMTEGFAGMAEGSAGCSSAE